MLEIAGTYADGTTTWVTGPKTLESHIIPIIGKAAEAAGKSAPRIVAGLPIAVTNDVAGAKEQIAKDLYIYGVLPSYKAMLDREGAAGPEDIALVGDEATVRAGIARLRDIGVTDFNAAIVPTGEGVAETTLALLADELGK
jgi:alkanesulfonate monooxygenase SsuD/methylene tetrahydromethanopterin reductase-like flavin-dependent oxidoreductase (luciferase family)